ncbi:MAG: hypothetical protein JST54_04260 [Deltaproteobacteria bacterium]|nr:hypothetical protein [Deltaproteobacteria bacterium]
MKKVYLLGLAMAGFAAGMYIQGCSGSGGTDGGSTVCHSDTDCATGDLCNTFAGICMTKCSQGSDCPTTEKTCAALPAPGTASGSVCQCSTDAICGTGFVCNKVDQACQQSCTSDANCSGYAQTRKCDTATGQCVISGGTDAGTDAGPVACGPSNLCTAGNFCDPTTNTCQAGTACTTLNTQDVCPAGQACYPGADVNTVGNICRIIANPDTSLANCAVSTNWDANSAPTIWGLTKGSIADPAGNCSTGTVDTFSGFWYDPTNNTPTGHFTGTGGPVAVYNAVVGVDSSGNTSHNGSTYNTYYDVNIDPSGTFSFMECSDNTGIVGVVIVTSTNVESNVACITE